MTTQGASQSTDLSASLRRSRDDLLVADAAGTAPASASANPYKSQFQVKIDTHLNSTSGPTTNLAAYENLASAYPDLKVVVGQCGLDPPSAAQVSKQRHLHWIIGGDSTIAQTLNDVQRGLVAWTMNEEPYETLEAAVNDMARALRGQAVMPHGVKFLPLTVYVKNTRYMRSIHFPAGAIESIAQARKSPDATS